MFMSMNVIGLVYQNTPDTWSSIHVLYQNTILEYSCWEDCCWEGMRPLAWGGEGCVPVHPFLCSSGERSRSFPAEETQIPRRWCPVLKPIKTSSPVLPPAQETKKPQALGWAGYLPVFSRQYWVKQQVLYFTMLRL